MKHFKNIETLERLKKEYRRLAKKHHPDLNHETDTTATMKEVNKEYEALFEQLKHETKHTSKEHVGTFKKIIDELIKYENITVDIVGSWVWVHGKGTFTIKDELKKLGFTWSKHRKKWYYADGLSKTGKRKRGKGSYQQITDKYGIERLNTKAKRDKKFLIAK